MDPIFEPERSAACRGECRRLAGAGECDFALSQRNRIAAVTQVFDNLEDQLQNLGNGSSDFGREMHAQAVTVAHAHGQQFDLRSLTQEQHGIDHLFQPYFVSTQQGRVVA